MSAPRRYVAHRLEEGVAVNALLRIGDEWLGCGCQRVFGAHHQPVFVRNGTVNRLPVGDGFRGGVVRHLLPTFEAIGTCWTQKAHGEPSVPHFAVWRDVREPEPPRMVNIHGAVAGELLKQAGERILGIATTPNGTEEAFVTDATFRDVTFLGHLGDWMSRGVTINHDGEVAGSSKTTDKRFHGFRWHPTRGLRDITPDSPYAGISAGREARELVGVWTVAPEIHHGVYFDSTDTPTDLPPLPLDEHLYSRASGINATGEIVGESAKRFDRGHDPRAVIWHDAVPFDLNACVESWAVGSALPMRSALLVTDDGMIVCQGEQGSDRFQAVLLPM